MRAQEQLKLPWRPRVALGCLVGDGGERREKVFKMVSSSSYHNFSLNSRIFNSRSHQNLHADKQNSSALYTSAAHSATEADLPSIREESTNIFTDYGDTITALPTPTYGPKRKGSFWNRSSSQTTENQAAVLKKPTPADKAIDDLEPADARIISLPPKSTKTAWKSFVTKVKRPFRGLKFGRAPKASEEKAELVIGSPSNFKHLGTLGAQPLRTASAPYTLSPHEDQGSSSEEEEEDEEEEEEQGDEWEDTE